MFYNNGFFWNLSFSFSFQGGTDFDIIFSVYVCDWYLNLVILVIVFFSDWLKLLIDFLNSCKSRLNPSKYQSLIDLLDDFLCEYIWMRHLGPCVRDCALGLTFQIKVWHNPCELVKFYWCLLRDIWGSRCYHPS